MITRRYPESKDNPGRVSEGTARDMRNAAEVYQRGGHSKDRHELYQHLGGPDESHRERNARKRQRKARRA